MVYYRRWEEFAGASEALYEASPVKTRYCVRWRHEAGLLVLKVTDDRTCIKFKTRSAVFFNRFEMLNRSLLAQFQHRKPLLLSKSLSAPSATAGAEDTQPDPASAPLAPTAVLNADEQPKSKKKKNKKKK